ncbi:MAG: dephospho-CoA kinase [Chloroflexi bacterium]|nr:dephospho-CoA kinase [Chloroflexota bacterium]
MTRIIGLTGGIGSGKSTVSQYLAEMGATIIDADKVGHEALTRSDIKQEIVAAFGHEVLGPDGEIDRKKLGPIVFGNPEALAKLNHIMHRRMRKMMEDKLAEYRKQGVPVVVMEAAVLLETDADWDKLVDEIWVTVSPEGVVVKRMKEQRGMTEEQTKARIRAQMSNEEKIKRAHVVISNDGSLDEMKRGVKKAWEKLVDKSAK